MYLSLAYQDKQPLLKWCRFLMIKRILGNQKPKTYNVIQNLETDKVASAGLGYKSKFWDSLIIVKLHFRFRLHVH